MNRYRSSQALHNEAFYKAQYVVLLIPKLIRGKREIWLGPVSKALIPTVNSKNVRHENATKNFDYTRLRTRWLNIPFVSKLVCHTKECHDRHHWVPEKVYIITIFFYKKSVYTTFLWWTPVIYRYNMYMVVSQTSGLCRKFIFFVNKSTIQDSSTGILINWTKLILKVININFVKRKGRDLTQPNTLHDDNAQSKYQKDTTTTCEYITITDRRRTVRLIDNNHQTGVVTIRFKDPTFLLPVINRQNI